MKYTLEEVLDAREKRWNIRQKISNSLKDGCLISVTLCVPQSFRINSEYKALFNILCDRIKDIFDNRKITIRFEKAIYGADGPAMFFSASSSPEVVKRISVLAEESIPGARLLDVDVTNNKGEVIGREQLGLPPRKCFVCSNPAHTCVSRRLHSSKDIALVIEKIFKEAKEKL